MLTVCYYNEDLFRMQSDIGLTDIDWPQDSKIWLDFDGRPDDTEIARLAELLAIHPIAVRGLFDESRRPRLQEFTDQVYLGARAIVTREETADIELRHIGFFMGNGFLITAHFGALEIIDRGRKRLESNAGEVRGLGADHLLYLLLDCIVDDYYCAVDQMAEEIDDLDTRSDQNYDRRLQHDILQSKRHLLVLHKAITPLRDVMLNLRRTDNPMVSPHTEIYLRDIFEHVLQLLDTVDTYREVLTNSTELAMAATNNRMNEVMTVLTVITTFFVPLNFIAGFYGMNLIMPENQVAMTYPIVIGIMVSIVISMFFWLKHKKWL